MARHSRTKYIVYPPMYRAGDGYHTVRSIFQAKKLVKRLYALGGGRGYEVWRWRSTKGRADQTHSLTSGFDGLVLAF
jgi:hypothetical protein